MEVIKLVHVASAALSIFGFIVRGVLMMLESAIMKARWIRVIPHFIDTVLLLTAITLFVQYGLSLFDTPWVMAKIIALLIYIYLGFIALRLGASKQKRIAAFFAAIIIFSYIVSVAVTKTPYVIF